MTGVTGANQRVFLSAEWRDLVMLNYAIDPLLLSRYVPSGTVLDSFEGRTYVSLVGFRFLRTRLLDRFSIPLHTNFEEVNLRFYVRRREGSDDRRGVTFIAEIVPRRAVARLARWAYEERYIRLPMTHSLWMLGGLRKLQYGWRLNGAWCTMHAQSSGEPAPAKEGSLEQFITEHYWGYSARRDGTAMEYRVAHAPWNVWPSSEAGFQGDTSRLYGAELGTALQRPPDSAFIADGSTVEVFRGRRIGR